MWRAGVQALTQGGFQKLPEHIVFLLGCVRVLRQDRGCPDRPLPASPHPSSSGREGEGRAGSAVHGRGPAGGHSQPPAHPHPLWLSSVSASPTEPPLD